MEPKIISCNITEMPKHIFDPMPRVEVRLDNGEDKTLFSFYPDEIDFTSTEFIGLTEKEAYRLKFKRDKNYIQS